MAETVLEIVKAILSIFGCIILAIAFLWVAVGISFILERIEKIEQKICYTRHVKDSRKRGLNEKCHGLMGGDVHSDYMMYMCVGCDYRSREYDHR